MLDCCPVLAGDVPVFNSEVLEQFVMLKSGEEKLTLHRRQVHVKVFQINLDRRIPENTCADIEIKGLMCRNCTRGSSVQAQ